MSPSVRVFALLGDAALRRRLQKQWRGNGITLCAMHAEGSPSLVEEIGRLRPQVLVVEADLEGVRQVVQTASRRFRIPSVCVVRTQQSGLGGLRAFDWGAITLVPRRDDDLDAFVALLEEAVHETQRAQVVEQLESVFPLSGAFPDASIFDLRRSLRALEPKDKLIVIAAGLGGPMAVRRILTSLHGQVSSPIVYVQRLGLELTDPLVRWLETHTGAQVQRARTGQPLEIGNVYVANHAHDAVRIVGADSGALLHVTGPNGAAQHVDGLLCSAAEVFGERAVGILLSGTGIDGSAGLACLRRAGGLTIAQDRASSPLYELPGHAREEGAAVECLPINEIAERVSMLMHPENAIKP